MMKIKLIVLALLFPLTLHADTNAKVAWIYHLGQCESGWSLIKHLDSNHFYSYDWVQFQMSTWLSYGKWANATPQNIHEAARQVIVAMKMLDAGETWHWKTCAAKTTENFGPYPN